jgi:hypothetical protein
MTDETIKAPSPEETAALQESQMIAEVRALVTQMAKSGALGFDPGTYTKGTITAISTSAFQAPTVTVNVSGDVTTAVPGIALLNNYSPVVGHTVIMGKMGPQVFVLGHIPELSASSDANGAGGWIKATLNAGTHNGNSNGDVCYRRILDHGAWKMQWRGGWNVSGTTMVSGLDTDYRPVAKRSVLCSRQVVNDGIAAQLDFMTDGSAVLVGGSMSTASGSVSGDITGGSGGATGNSFVGPTTAWPSDAHNHGVIAGDHAHSTGSHTHSFSGGAHSHVTAPTPTWVGLHGVEYFL